MGTREANPLIGVGLYSPVQAARLLHVPTRQVHRWLFGDSDHPPAVASYFEDNDGPQRRCVTFFDLVQLMVIREAAQHQVKLEAIREAVAFARESLNDPMPLANKKGMFLFDGSVWGRQGNRNELVGLSKKDRNQLASVKVIQEFAKEITFDENGRAESWTPMRRGKLRVTLHRNRRFGQPTINPPGYVTTLIAPSVIGEGSVRAAARAYGIPTAAMQLAYDFERRHGVSDLYDSSLTNASL